MKVVYIIIIMIFAVNCIRTDSPQESCKSSWAESVFVDCVLISMNIPKDQIAQALCMQALDRLNRCNDKSDVPYYVPWTD
jgi:hypothetical protein